MQAGDLHDPSETLMHESDLDNPYAGGRSSHAAPPTLGQHNESIRAWLDS